MACAFKVGDVVVSRTGGAIYEILESGVNGPWGKSYKVKVLMSRNKNRIGAVDFKPTKMIDNDYHLQGSKNPWAKNTLPDPSVQIPAGTVVMIKHGDIDQTMIDTMRKQFSDATKLECECGAHKCGYSNEEVHGHSRWCPVVTKAFRTPIFDKEA